MSSSPCLPLSLSGFLLHHLKERETRAFDAAAGLLSKHPMLRTGLVLWHRFFLQGVSTINSGRVDLRDPAAGISTTSPYGVCLEVLPPPDRVDNVEQKRPLVCDKDAREAVPAAASPPDAAASQVPLFSGFVTGRGSKLPIHEQRPAANEQTPRKIEQSPGNVRAVEIARRMSAISSSASCSTMRYMQREYPVPFIPPRKVDEASPSRPKRGRGLTGPILLGPGSSGEYADVDIERRVEDCAKSTVHVSGACWVFNRCGIMCAAGVALVSINGAEADLSQCSVGGLGQGDLSAYNGLVALNSSLWAIEVSTPHPASNASLC